MKKLGVTKNPGNLVEAYDEIAGILVSNDSHS